MYADCKEECTVTFDISDWREDIQLMLTDEERWEVELEDSAVCICNFVCINMMYYTCIII